MENADLDFYTLPAAMTSAGKHATLIQGLPRDPAALARIIQGVLLHEHFAPAYGVTLTDERRRESHIRSLEKMLDRILVHDPRPLSAARPLETRTIGVCRHFSVVLAGMLRVHGIPARARCGFGAYFITGQFEDHWVCEYWNGAESRWVLVDAQIDEVQRKVLPIDFDLLDVPRDRFVIAGDAWARCRAGLDPAKFGIFNMRGLWFVGGNVLRDFASLNNMEMLPWDVWGPMNGPDEPFTEERLSFLDEIAALTRSPDAKFGELRRAYESDDRLHVPATVFNAVLQRPDPV